MKTLLWTLPALGLAILTAPSFAQPPTAATFIDSNRVAAAFTKGMPLLEKGEFKVHASRREVPGVAEIHTRDTDIIHVLEGSATFVTGGTAVEPKTIARMRFAGRKSVAARSAASEKAMQLSSPMVSRTGSSRWTLRCSTTW